MMFFLNPEPIRHVNPYPTSLTDDWKMSVIMPMNIQKPHDPAMLDIASTTA
jgi:hypothetical protein